MVRERKRDRPQPIAIEEFLGLLTGDEAGGAVAIPRDHEILWTDLTKRSLAGKKFQARLFGSKPRRDARHSTGPVTGVLEFLCGKDPQEVLLGGLMKQALYSRDLHRVDATAREWTGTVHGPSP